MVFALQLPMLIMMESSRQRHTHVLSAVQLYGAIAHLASTHLPINLSCLISPSLPVTQTTVISPSLCVVISTVTVTCNCKMSIRGLILLCLWWKKPQDHPKKSYAQVHRAKAYCSSQIKECLSF